MRYGSFFSGIGGLDLAVEAFFEAECAWHVEFDPIPASILAKQWDVPNLQDVKAIDWAQVEPVDIVCGGYPCQPFSIAGLRKGTDDDRHLWPYFADAIRVLRPEWVVLENVSAHLGFGFDAVLADLAGIGFDAEWAVVRASDVGAPHRRARLFVVAHAERSGVHADGRVRRGDECGGDPAGGAALPAGPEVARSAVPLSGSAVAAPDPGSSGPEGRDDAGRGRATPPLEGRGREVGSGERGHVGGARPPAAGDTTGDGGKRREPTAGEAESGRTRPDAGRSVGVPADASCMGRRPGAGLRESGPGGIGGRRLGDDDGAAHADADGEPGADAGERGDPRRRGDVAADADAVGREGRQELDVRPSERGDIDSAAGGHADGHRPEMEWGEYGPAIARWEYLTGRLAPAPTDGRGRLNPPFVEWMMGLPAGWTDGLKRSGRLKALGNAVVPAQAYYALCLLTTVDSLCD